MVKPFLLTPRIDGTIIKKRRDELVFRQKGKAGADLTCTIAGEEAALLEQQFITEWAKINRATRLMLMNAQLKGVKARQAKAAARIKIPKTMTRRQIKAAEICAKVIELYVQGKKPYHIAQQTGLTVRRVNQILKKTGK